MSGPNEALYREAVRRFPDLEWQASGGIRSAADLQGLSATGVSAAVSGRALLEERLSIEELTPFLRNA
jgi:phosphoribosylformimino-5-aminoimidazole carboxamide ribotide isomerase